MSNYTNYKQFLDITFTNMVTYVRWLSELDSEVIKSLFIIKGDFLDEENYEDFVNTVYNRNSFEKDKAFLKTYLSEFLINYLTTLLKNSIIKVFYERAVKNQLTYSDYIEVFNYITVYYKIKDKADDLFYNIKIKWVRSKDKNKIIALIFKKLKELHQRSDVKTDSIFYNQLIKFLKSKKEHWNNKYEQTMNNDYDYEIVSYKEAENQAYDPSFDLYSDFKEKAKKRNKK